MYRAAAPPSDGPQREAQRDRSPQDVRLDEPAGDELGQRRAVLPAKVEESRARLLRIEGGAACQRGVIAGQAVPGTAEQEPVHRPEQQEGRLLAGSPPPQQLQQLPVRGHGQAQRLVQGRGVEDGQRLAEILRQSAGLGALGHASPSDSAAGRGGINAHRLNAGTRTDHARRLSR